MSTYITLKKFTDTIPNEDSCQVRNDMIAISDGAGGCGVFASDWSKYLVDNIANRPNDEPIVGFEQLDAWVGEIWEQFYNDHEAMAKQYDGIFQSKFYQEGSYATLAVVWQTGCDICHWITYGDSVVFHYSKSQRKFEHSFTKLADFSKPPYLISCKDSLQEEGFRTGDFVLYDDSVLFAASDALSHYILMMYYVTHPDEFKDELDELLQSHTTDASMVSIAQKDNTETFDTIIGQLQDISHNQEDFDKHVKELHKRGVLDIDDYTLAFLKYNDTPCSTH